jgi:hypothetical protein
MLNKIIHFSLHNRIAVLMASVLLLSAAEQEAERTTTHKSILIKISRQLFVELTKITFILILHLYRSNIRINQPYNNVKHFVLKQVQKETLL